MKLKVLFLSTAILTVAALFTFCSKETPASETVQTANTEQEEAGSRAPCQVTIQALGGCIDVCGVSSSAVVPQCGVSSTGQILRGTISIPINGVVNVWVDAPTSLLISRGACVSGQMVTAKLTSGNVTFAPVPMVGNVQVDIDANCMF